MRWKAQALRIRPSLRPGTKPSGKTSSWTQSAPAFCRKCPQRASGICRSKALCWRRCIRRSACGKCRTTTSFLMPPGQRMCAPSWRIRGFRQKHLALAIMIPITRNRSATLKCTACSSGRVVTSAYGAFYPTFARYPVLLPILPAYRFTRGIIKFNGKKRLKAELKALSDRSL